MSSPPPPPDPSKPESSESAVRRLLNRVYTHNPFYLLSVCCVFHGTSYWMQNAGAYRAYPLIGLVAGYILLLAIVAMVIVRAGKVWDDARSILLIIPMLFVELSLTFDDPLLTTPWLGGLLVLAGFLFAAVIAEGVLQGLRIHLPLLLRLPLHGLLGLMILYPLVLAPGFNLLTPVETSWRIYLFFPMAGLLLLSLIPAIRKGPGYVRRSPAPWRWPWHPWTIFAVLLGGVCVRGYALSLSFDPVLSLKTDAAMSLESAWGLYFLSPILLTLGFLLLEFGLVQKQERLKQIALFFPMLAVGLSIPPMNASAPYTDFLKQFTSCAGSPIFVSLLSAAAFYGIALARRVQLSELALGLVLLLLAVVGPNTINIDTVASPNPLPLRLACVLLVIRGLMLRKSLPALAGLFFGIAALRIDLPSEWPSFWQNAVCLHLIGIVVLAVGATFRDALAHWLRRAAGFLLSGGCLFALVGQAYLPPALPAWIIPAYVGNLILLTFALTIWLKSWQYLVVGLFNLAIGSSAMLREAYFVLRTLPEWRGIASFAVAFLLLAIGGSISAAKAGLFERLKVVVSHHLVERRVESS